MATIIKISSTSNESKKDLKKSLKNHKPPNFRDKIKKILFRLKEFLIKNREIIFLLIKICFSILHNHHH